MTIINIIYALFVIVSGIQSGHSTGKSSEISGKKYAEHYYTTASTIHAALYGPLAEFIVSKYKLSGSSGIGIDLGGGPGHLAIELARRTGTMHWINADINPYFFTYVRSLADDNDLGHRISTLYTDVHDLPLKDNVADIIVSRGSFHFWNDKRKAFAEIYRVLKPGGAAFIGRGFSENLPVDTARRIRETKRKRSSGVSYDIEKTATELESIMKSLGIKNYTIILPKPPGSEGVNYGIWLEFQKHISQ